MIVGEENQAAYYPLTIIFQQLTVGHLATSITTPHPSTPAYSSELTIRYTGILENAFSSLPPGAPAHANTQIATAIVALATQNQQHNQEKAMKKRPRRLRLLWVGLGPSA